MLEINLVPQQLQKKKRKGPDATPGVTIAFPKELLIGLVGGLIFLLLVAHGVLLGVTVKKFAKHEELKAEWTQVKPNKERVDVIINDLRLLKKRINSVKNVITVRNIPWSGKLNVISNNLPRGVWLKRIAMDENVLIIEGSAVSKGKDEMINVHKFTSNLKAEKDFLNYLTDLELGSIQRRKVSTTEIADFTIKAKVVEKKEKGKNGRY